MNLVYKFLHLPAFVILSFVIIGLTYHCGTQLLSFLIDIDLVDISYESPFFEIIYMFYEATGVIVFIIISHVFLNTPGFKEIGIGFRSQSRYLALGTILALLLTLPYLIVVYCLGDEIYINTQFSVKAMFQFFVFYTLAAINEELFYRGFMEKEFIKLINFKVAIPVSAIFFAWSHFYNLSFLFELADFYYFINLVLWGIIFSLCYHYSRNIWFPIIVHLCFNSFRKLFGIYDYELGLLEIKEGKWAVYIDRYDAFIWMIFSLFLILLLIKFKDIFHLNERNSVTKSN